MRRFNLLIGKNMTNILLTGGVRSGKSRMALSLAHAYAGNKYFLATAEASDASMHSRIQAHQAERSVDFQTLEEPLHLDEVLSQRGKGDVVIVDCLTLWLHNLFFHYQEDKDKIQQHQEDFLKVLKESSATIIIVTNEVGWGIIPENRLARDYQDALGGLNQSVAAGCGHVALMVAGIPQWVKGRGELS